MLAFSLFPNFLLLLLAICHVHGMFGRERERKSEEKRTNSRSSSRENREPDNGILSIEVVPSLAGNPLHGYRFVVRCGTLKFREYSRAESEELRWIYPTKEPEKVEIQLTKERCLNMAVFIFMTTRNQTDTNLWNKQFQANTSSHHLSVDFVHYSKLTVSPNLGQVVRQSYYVQVRCANTTKDPDVLFHTEFKSETVVVLLENPNCVVFTAKLWVVWPNQKLKENKPKFVLKNIGITQSLPVPRIDFTNNFLMEISPPLESSRVYVVYVWCAGPKKARRMKFVSKIREEWCTTRKCPVQVLINSKNGPRGTTTSPVYDIAVAEADEDWDNVSELDEMPEQIVFRKQNGVRIERGATFLWEHRPRELHPTYYNFRK
ncbi:hypothetical protein niasHT_022308 [Heterodera trifolii]|uniref:Uncharacterized protein n=1 Tax=Heterodera trifolii TaxID=157864 RepID=A0ABD2KNT0_9BILA